MYEYLHTIYQQLFLLHPIVSTEKIVNYCEFFDLIQMVLHF